MSVFIRDIEYVTGAQYIPFREVEAIASDGPSCVKFEESGFSTFSFFDGSPEQLCLELLQRRNAALGTKATDIDAVIVVRGSKPVQFDRALIEAGLDVLPVIEIEHAQCANIVIAIDLARTLILSGRHRNILCVSADKVSSHEERNLLGGWALLGDGAACCTVSCEDGDFEVLGARHLSSLHLRIAHMSSDSMVRHYALAGKVAELLQSDTQVSGSEYVAYIGPNMGVLPTLHAGSAGVPQERVFMENLPRTAHVSTSDCLINLKDIQDSGLTGGQLIMLGSMGLNSVGMVSLRVTSSTGI
ncbi:beta-ketoacyl-[acyl-carrier-protein] synthase family protein [Sphingobium sp. TomTYG45]